MVAAVFMARRKSLGTTLDLGEDAVRRILDAVRGLQMRPMARVGFAARRTAQQQRDLAVGHGLLGQVVVHDQRVFAAVAEVFGPSRSPNRR